MSIKGAYLTSSRWRSGNGRTRRHLHAGGVRLSFYQWQANVSGYRGVNPAAGLRFFIGKQPRRARTDLEWFRHDEAAVLLEACRALKPRWTAFLLVCFTGGLRWGKATALYSTMSTGAALACTQRTWSEDGGRIEATKDGENC